MRPFGADGTPTAHGLQFRPRQRGDAGAPAAFAAGLQFRPHEPVSSYAFEAPASHLVAAGPNAHSPGHEGGKVSHGASEKQRRDRINSMIDQLRVIGARCAACAACTLARMRSSRACADADAARAVPSDAPRTGRGGSAGGDTGEQGRRSKFVVLQQTINTLRSLQLRCAAQEDELARLRGGAAPPAPGSGGRPAPGAAPASAGAAPSELASLPAAIGGAVPCVDVHQGSDARVCYLRVTCVDRRGLLADILNALRAMPLEVVRAAITTSADGHASDCFELRLAPGADGAALRRDDIKRAVETQLLVAASDGDDDGKRRKTSVTRAAAATSRR